MYPSADAMPSSVTTAVLFPWWVTDELGSAEGVSGSGIVMFRGGAGSDGLDGIGNGMDTIENKRSAGDSGSMEKIRSSERTTRERSLACEARNSDSNALSDRSA